MDRDFWLQRWQENEIGFHMSEANPVLVKHIDKLCLAKSSRLFLPLCGKTLDIAWLLSQGFQVVGAELSQVAIEQLYAELGVEPKISALGSIKRYSAEGIDIYVGDIFDLTNEIVGSVDAVYDRAALVALPQDMRTQYVQHLIKITKTSPQLLLSFEYDQSLMSGPPFAVSSEEIQQHYAEHYQVELLERMDVPGGLRGKCDATENIWLLEKN